MKSTEQTPELMAHRGYASLYPENTIEAVVAAGEAGITQIEFDVQLTKDGIPVVLHDMSLQRTTGLKQSIFATDLADLSDIEANYTELFGDACSGIRIPTLESMLDLLSERPEWRFFVEIKRESIQQFGSTFVIDQLLPLIYEHLAQIVIISFDYEFLVELCHRSDVEVGWVLSEYSDQAEQAAVALDPDYLIVNYRRLPPAPEPLWPGAWHWACYEVTEATLARQLLSRGIDIVSSMAAPALQRQLGAEV
jgi:glycerophosphoryl diester phosphodiesterase